MGLHESTQTGSLNPAFIILTEYPSFHTRSLSMKSHLTRRQFVLSSAATVAAGLAGSQWSVAAESQDAWSVENQYLKLVLGADGRTRGFIDKQTGVNYCAGDGKTPVARVMMKSGRPYDASSAQFAGDRVTLAFGDSGVRAAFKATMHPRHLVWEVVSVEGEDIKDMAFIDIPLTLKGAMEEPFVAVPLALNERTNVVGLPEPTSRLCASCYPRFGMPGTKVAIVASPPSQLRAALQEAVTAAEELPHSSIGGPWALGQPINQGSYLFNFGDMTIEKADDWIRLVQTLGLNQIDFHGGGSFRFGDCFPNPKTYPEGKKSLKAVIDKLHAAGIKAGLHTYAFFIAKNCPWVTPVPDPRLASDAVLTLSADISADAKDVAIVESTAEMSTITNFFVRNSVTLRIDDELITYSGVAKESPFACTGCKRGAYGTQAAAHAKGAKAHHLKECFGLFVPDPNTTLFDEVAACTADTFNECGFDMIYLDALDGSDVLGGSDAFWHYSARFLYAIWRRLKRPALTESSACGHHEWCIRSRLGASDHPNRSYKKFIDLHCQGNLANRRLFLPGQLGWWALKQWSGAQTEPTFADDIEYLMGKCLGTDTGFALMGIDPNNVGTLPALPRLAAIIRRYEELRHSGKVSDSIKARLRVPGDEHTLIGSLQEGWQFRPVRYDKHKVENAQPWSSRWKTTNQFAAQPVRLRIEALMSAGGYDAPGNVVLADFASAEDFATREAAASVSAAWTPSKELPPADAASDVGADKIGNAGGCLTAANGRPDRLGSWTRLQKAFSPPQNLSNHQALGLWVHGDGQGETLNVQLKSPPHLVSGTGDHYIVVDFTGWRYFELIEPEGERYENYQWPYAGGYDIYREPVQFGHVATLGLWYNDLPPGKPVTCYLSPIKAMPLVAGKWTNPTLTIAGQTITFPVEMESGQYLELLSAAECNLHGPSGELIRKVEPQGAIPTLQPGENEVSFQVQPQPGVTPRAKVTLMTEGEACA